MWMIREWDKGEGEGWDKGRVRVGMGSLVVMVGVGPLQPLACAISSGDLPWAGKPSEHWEKSDISIMVSYYTV